MVARPFVALHMLPIGSHRGLSDVNVWCSARGIHMWGVGAVSPPVVMCVPFGRPASRW